MKQQICCRAFKTLLVLTCTSLSVYGIDLRDFNPVGGYKNFQGFLEGQGHSGPQYTDKWLVRIEGGPLTAAVIAADLGYDNLGQVPGFDNFYIMRKPMGPTSTSSMQKRGFHQRATSSLLDHSKVLWAEELVSKRRDKRDGIWIPDKPSDVELIEDDLTYVNTRTKRFKRRKREIFSEISHKVGRSKDRRFNDELWDHEWYLQDTRNYASLPELDLHVLPVYDMGYTGKGVKITVLDDGIEYNHTDLALNYDPSLSYDANDMDHDPWPRYDDIDTNSHGTRCAGEIAMVANNKKCGVGVAYGASIGGIRMLDGSVTDAVEGTSLGFNVENMDIFSSSWGPADDGRTVEGPGELTNHAFKKGVTKGRNGKGSIYVWAAGNGGHRGDSCACDGYASSPYTIAVGSASQSGKFPWYGEKCGSTMAATYSSGAYKDQKITTTDLHDSCTVDHTGTSAAAPLAAGIIALVLEANPKLTWRDVQHLVVHTSDNKPLFDNSGWSINAAGLMFNPRFGFGLMNAKSMVTAALNWENVPQEVICQQHFQDAGSVKIVNYKPAYITYGIDKCKNNDIGALEHVELTVNIRYPKRGALQVTLISPSGTVSEILSPRPHDNSSLGFKDWTFMSVHFWGETVVGNWTFIVEDVDVSHKGDPEERQDPQIIRQGSWDGVTFTFHGTQTPPKATNSSLTREDIDKIRVKLKELDALRMEQEAEIQDKTEPPFQLPPPSHDALFRRPRIGLFDDASDIYSEPEENPYQPLFRFKRDA